METYDLTPGELKAALILVANCLGPTLIRPSDLYTCVTIETLCDAGYSWYEAAEYFSSLIFKGILKDYGNRDYTFTLSACRWLDSVWDANQWKISL